MEARLLDSLHHKLQDLESRIRAHRLDLIHDFQQHYHDLLLDVNPDVASTIHQAIVSSFVDYPTLRPELEAATDSQPSPDDVGNPPLAAAHQQAPLSVIAASTDTEPAESSHEREDGLHGLFIPSYLPLLEGFPPRASSPPAGVSIATMTSPSGEPLSPSFPLEAGTGQKVFVMDVIPDLRGTASSTPQEPVDVNAGGRIGTDDSTSSVCSDKSDSKVRRSALRRSSSLSKPPQSPRRVRFEFMGAEVLPTASPQSSEFTAFIASSPFPDDEESINSDTILDADLEDPETPPPPPKISSSDALRALSRAPVEDGTIWTVVNPDMEPSESQQEKIVNNLLMTHNAMEKITGMRADEESGTSGVYDGSHVKWLRLEDTNHDSELDEGVDDESSEDEGEYLAMVTPRSPRIAAAPAPTASQSNTDGTYNKHAATTVVAKKESVEFTSSDDAKDHDVSDDEFDDDMFQFEPGGLTAPPKPRQMPPPEPEDVSDDESNGRPLPETHTSQAPAEESPAAVSITRPPRFEPIALPVAKVRPASVGSYKGRPVVMPVVRDADLYARAASLGNFNTFVGGLDGRSGIDEGDLSSFRNSVVHTAFTGTPRSLTERFMMEEAQSERMRKNSPSPR